MDIQIVHGKVDAHAADAVLLYTMEGGLGDNPNQAARVMDTALNGAISELVAAGDFTGKLSEIVVLYSRKAVPAARVILVGLGKVEEFTVDSARRAVAAGL